MKRVSKNLTKAVTLSVLLMLPYGMAWAETYTDVISGANDEYTDEIKKYDEDTNTYIYDFSKDDDAKLDVTATESYDRAISVKDSSIKIKGQLDVTVRADKEGGRYGYFPYSTVSLSGNNLLFDRRDGGTITQIDGDDSAVRIYGQGNAIYLGNGNIEQTINNDSSPINDVSGIEIYGGNNQGNNNLIVYGEDTIKTTAKQNETIASVGYNRISGVEIDINASDNNKIILGYKGNYDDLDEFNQENIAEKVKQLGAVTIDLTAENTCQDNNREAKVIGIRNAADNGNIIAGVITKASGYTIKDDDDSISAAGVYMSGMENNNIIAANKFMITAEAESKSDGMVSAMGIVNTAVNDKNTINYVNAFGDGSDITATATGNMLTVNGISAYEAQAMKIIDGYGREYIIYSKNGDVEVNTGAIDITTTTNNGTDIENIGIRANGGTVNINGDAGIKVYVNNAADTNSDVFGIWSNLGGTVNVEGAANITINDNRLDAKKNSCSCRYARFG